MCVHAARPGVMKRRGIRNARIVGTARQQKAGRCGGSTDAMKLILLATLAAGRPHTTAAQCSGVPGVDCCNTGPYVDDNALAQYQATLCYNHQCPNGYTRRDSCDCHEPDGGPTDDECCVQVCGDAGVQCAEGETLRTNHMCYSGMDCTASCCDVTCSSCVRPPAPPRLCPHFPCDVPCHGSTHPPAMSHVWLHCPPRRQVRWAVCSRSKEAKRRSHVQ